MTLEVVLIHTKIVSIVCVAAATIALIRRRPEHWGGYAAVGIGLTITSLAVTRVALLGILPADDLNVIAQIAGSALIAIGAVLIARDFGRRVGNLEAKKGKGDKKG